MLDYNCLIIEDEPLAAGVISDYINKTPGLRLNGICEDVFTARKMLAAYKTDILFADINLPEISGMDFITTLNNRYHVIFITAHHEFAPEGFNNNAVDYLLKPVGYSRFLKAINKLYTNIGVAVAGEKVLFLNAGRKMIRITDDDILYIESMKDNVVVYCESASHTIKMNLYEIDGLLSKPGFLRIHKSFIVNCSKISAFTSQIIEIGKHKIPVGRTYKKNLEVLFTP
jgi:DNA-binding LytR/AlgR family response regulator